MAKPTNVHFWKFKLLEIVVVIYVFVGRADGYSNGAPTTRCVSMIPGHQVDAQTGTSPFSITTDKSTYSAGVPIKVTISGPAFKGFLLEARGKNDAIVGTFSSPPANTKLVQCSNPNDAQTHSNKNPKDDPVFTWNPPSGDEGDVQFIATVVIAYATIWTKNTSPVIKYMAPTTTTQTTTSTTAATTMKPTTSTTTASVVNPSTAAPSQAGASVTATMDSMTTTGDMMNGTTKNMTSNGTDNNSTVTSTGEVRAAHSYSIFIYAILTILLVTLQPFF